MLYPGRKQGFDQFQALLRGQDALLILQPITRAHIIDDHDFAHVGYQKYHSTITPRTRRYHANALNVWWAM